MNFTTKLTGTKAISVYEINQHFDIHPRISVDYEATALINWSVDVIRVEDGILGINTSIDSLAVEIEFSVNGDDLNQPELNLMYKSRFDLNGYDFSLKIKIESGCGWDIVNRMEEEGNQFFINEIEIELEAGTITIY